MSNNEDKKIRVKGLAEVLGMTSTELRAKCKDAGIGVGILKGPRSVVSAELEKEIRRTFDSPDLFEQPSSPNDGKVIEEAPAEEEEPDFDENPRFCLDVKYEHKDIVKSKGARWDKSKRTWYITGEQHRDNKAFWDTYLPANHEPSELDEPDESSPNIDLTGSYISMDARDLRDILCYGYLGVINHITLRTLKVFLILQVTGLTLTQPINFFIPKVVFQEYKRNLFVWFDCQIQMHSKVKE